MSLPTSATPALAASIDYYDAYNSSDKCFLSTPLYIFQTYVKIGVCNQNMSYDDFTSEIGFDKKSWKTIGESVRSMLIMMTVVLGFALAHICCRNLLINTVKRFMLEFLLIMGSVILIAAADKYNDFYVVTISILLLLHMWHAKVWQNAPTCTYQVGSRPVVFTLLRATTYVGTCCAILAIDFVKVFAKENHKSRQFGAACMDLGIGFFVFNMGTVSRRSESIHDLLKLYKTLIPLLALGLARTVVISMLDYHYDDHEYGRHWNAFITLAFAKLFGSVCSLLARSDNQLLPLSLGISLLHELGLQLGLSDFVMLDDTGRDNWLTANREGLSAVPGTVALYLLSMYFGKWYKAKQQLSYTEMQQKLFDLLIIAIGGWLMVFNSAYLVGIARVTFNLGYNIWIFTVCATMMLIYAFLFEFGYSTSATDNKGQQQLLCNNAEAETEVVCDQLKSACDRLPVMELPQLVESVNLNGLTFFMLANFLTGFVNMTLEPKEYDAPEFVIIMLLYMLGSTGVVYILYRLNIRIA